MIIGTTHVWRINGQLIVADTIEKAIEVFKGKFEYPAEVDKIERVYNDGYPETSVAYVESNDEPLKFNPSNCDPDFYKPLDGMVDGFRDVKCDNTITLVGDGAKGKIRDACTEDYTPFKDIPIIQTNNENKTDLEPF